MPINLDINENTAFEQIAEQIAVSRPTILENNKIATMDSSNAEIIMSLMLMYAEGFKLAVHDSPLDKETNKTYMIPEYIIDIFLTQCNCEIEPLPNNHPLKYLNSIKKYYVDKERDPSLDTEDKKQEAINNSFQFIEKTWAKVQTKPDILIVENQADLIKANANLVIKKKGNMNTLEQLGPNKFHADKNIADDQAKIFAKVMQDAENFRHAYKQSLTNFVGDKNDDENANGLSLFNRLQKKRAAVLGDKPKVTIIGLGPSGIETAIRAYLEGAQVTAIENRDTYKRNNTFRLPEEFVHELYNLFIDNPDNIQHLPEQHPLKVITNKLETIKKGPHAPSWGPYYDQYYQMSIKDYEELTRCILDVLAKHDPDDVIIHQGAEYLAGSSITPDKTVTIRTGTRDASNKFIPETIKTHTIETDYLVDTSGGRAVTLNESRIKKNQYVHI